MQSSLERKQIPEKLHGRDIIFFDGDCVLCNKLAQELMQMDKQKHFLLAAQQSQIAEELLAGHNVRSSELSTIYLIEDLAGHNEKLYSKSTAVLKIMQKSKLKSLANLLLMIPAPARDLAYMLVAASRYKIFGKTKSSCALLNPEDRDRIIS